MDNKIMEQIVAIRFTGETNMFDVRKVQEIANKRAYYELVIFIEEHRKKYLRFILNGEE